jgi:hypothetical protein
MEQHLGRTLGPDEVVHHRDGDPSNNSIENLEVKGRIKHLQDHARDDRPPEMIEITCIGCGKTKQKLARQVRHNSKQGKIGPFCNKSCSGKWSRKLQISNGKINLRNEKPPEHGEIRCYWQGCRCDMCRYANANKQRAWRMRRRKSVV